MKLKKIAPPEGNVNINEALDWLKNRRNMIKTEHKALGKEQVIDNLELLEFKV